MVQVLLERGAQQDLKNVYNAEYEHNENGSETSGSTPLHLAAAGGHKDVVELLLEKGAEPNQAQDGDGWTPLHIVADNHKDTYWHKCDQCDDLKDSVKLLLDAGSDPNRGDYVGYTPLHLAVNSYDKVVVQLLLDAGADPNKASAKGGTPLMWAASQLIYGRYEVIRLFQERGYVL